MDLITNAIQTNCRLFFTTLSLGTTLQGKGKPMFFWPSHRFRVMIPGKASKALSAEYSSPHSCLSNYQLLN